MSRAPVREPRVSFEEFVARLKGYGIYSGVLIIVARYHGVTLEDVYSRKRYVNASKARYAAIEYVRNRFPSWSLPTLGNLFGLNHTSVLIGLRKRRGRVRIAC